MKTPHLTLASLGLCLLLASCASTKLPPKLSQAESERLKELPLPYTVGVARDNDSLYSDRLTKVLEQTGVFTKVAPLDSYKKAPDLIATVEEHVYGTSMIPVGYLLTFGVIPSIVEERHGEIFSLAPPKHWKKRVIVDASYKGSTTLGWAAPGVALSPDYCLKKPDQSKRFREMIAYRTLQALRPNKLP